MSEWMPIETAPKEEPVLVACESFVYAAIHADAVAYMNMEGGWYYYGTYDRLDESPTHWMPLPAPPLPDANGGRE